MRITVKVGIIGALVWIVLKLGFLAMGWNTKEMLPYAVMLNILGVLLSIAIGLYLYKKQNSSNDANMLQDIKNAMTAGVPYTILVSVFIYFYYAEIDPQYNERQIEAAEVQILETLSSEEGLREIRESNKNYEVMTKSEIYAEMREGPKNLYSAKFTMTVSLLALLLLATINSIFVAIIYRKVLFPRLKA